MRKNRSALATSLPVRASSYGCEGRQLYCQHFSDFCLQAFNTSREQKPCISQLSVLLRDADIGPYANHVVAYAHCLLMFAKAVGDEKFAT